MAMSNSLFSIQDAVGNIYLNAGDIIFTSYSSSGVWSEPIQRTSNIRIGTLSSGFKILDARQSEINYFNTSGKTGAFWRKPSDKLMQKQLIDFTVTESMLLIIAVLLFVNLIKSIFYAKFAL